MQLSRIIQSFLFRDLLSYLLPGLVALSSVLFLEISTERLDHLERIVRLVGSFSSSLFLLSLAYAAGYLISTITYIAWDFLARIWPPSAVPTDTDLLTALKDEFGASAERRDGDSDRSFAATIVDLCLNHVQAYDPESFTMNIERYYSMKNFEIALSGALVIWTITVAIEVSICLALLPLIPALYIFCFASRRLDSEIDTMAVVTYRRLQKLGAPRTGAQA